MTEIQNEKSYNLENRTKAFAKDVALFCRKLPRTTPNSEYTKQVIRSSGSIGANYIEANESLSKKDFLMRVKICRKEAKETMYWLDLIVAVNGGDFSPEGSALNQEAFELRKIFSSIITKSS
jgi:four helix bundle protein